MPAPIRRKVGRPAAEEPRTPRCLRCTAEEWATFQALGGSAWLRGYLKRARLSEGQAAARDALLAELKGQARLVE